MNNTQRNVLIGAAILAVLLLTGVMTGLLHYIGVASVLSPSCFVSMDGAHNITPVCSGGIITSNLIGLDGCGYITCTNATNYLTAKACNKPGDYQPTYFELYAYNTTYSPITICLDGTCVGPNSGWSTSKNYTICAVATSCPITGSGTYPSCSCPTGQAYQLSTNTCGVSATTSTTTTTAVGVTTTTVAGATTTAPTSTTSVSTSTGTGGGSTVAATNNSNSSTVIPTNVEQSATSGLTTSTTETYIWIVVGILVLFALFGGDKKK